MKWFFSKSSQKAATHVDYIELTILLLIRVAFAVGVGLAVWQGNYETAGIVFVGLALSFLPQLIERSFKVHMPLGYEFIIVAFIFASIYLGELNQAYEQFWWWDIALHASSGVIAGYVGFLILYTLYRQRQLVASAGIIAFFTFAVGMMSAGLWEMFEFGVDQLLGKSMQHGLVDTMSDTIVACLGSLLAAAAAYWHIKWPDSSPLRRTLHRFFSVNPHLPVAKHASVGKKK